ncbi:MAG: hypothetical protein AVDCRST_MAG05-3686, partial [uncultured Rubrobacteraceae bacterium]
ASEAGRRPCLRGRQSPRRFAGAGAEPALHRALDPPARLRTGRPYGPHRGPPGRPVFYDAGHLAPDDGRGLPSPASGHPGGARQVPALHRRKAPARARPRPARLRGPDDGGRWTAHVQGAARAARGAGAGPGTLRPRLPGEDAAPARPDPSGRHLGYRRQPLLRPARALARLAARRPRREPARPRPPVPGGLRPRECQGLPGMVGPCRREGYLSGDKARIGSLPGRGGERAVRRPGRSAAAGRHPRAAPLRSRVRQPRPLPRRPEARHRRREPQRGLSLRRAGQGHVPDRRLRGRGVEDREDKKGRRPGRRAVRALGSSGPRHPRRGGRGPAAFRYRRPTRVGREVRERGL